MQTLNKIHFCLWKVTQAEFIAKYTYDVEQLENNQKTLGIDFGMFFDR